ncbi:hypothetical protein NEMBOFW57_009496 [Staphylotrichum longicolle]|uniref:Ankyrin n=1 Tax=Staphylotrichum longicolle TaxID=669026 RepID=A0AAD4HVH9_9PEZI|nr:hypothetical protein NEMBOFW57_009496 [Staphylotrichum longicolle]
MEEIDRSTSYKDDDFSFLRYATTSVDVDTRDESGRTPLSWAAEKGHGAVVKLLLGTGKVDLDARDESGRTPLSWAAEKGHETVVKLLLSKGKVNTPKAVVRLLLGTGKVDVDQIRPDAVVMAAGEGHEAIVKLLLGTGKVDVDAKDSKYSRTPLSWAAKEGHEAVVKLLLGTGKVDVDPLLLLSQQPQQQRTLNSDPL